MDAKQFRFPPLDVSADSIEMREKKKKTRPLTGVPNAAQPVAMVRELRDAEVVAPGEARFECEVSAPVHQPPTWSLNGEPVSPGPQVRLEKLGSVHRLTLRQTSTAMSGVVDFACGQAKSSAKLKVWSE